jgi:hypothetical protein
MRASSFLAVSTAGCCAWMKLGRPRPRRRCCLALWSGSAGPARWAAARGRRAAPWGAGPAARARPAPRGGAGAEGSRGGVAQHRGVGTAQGWRGHAARAAGGAATAAATAATHMHARGCCGCDADPELRAHPRSASVASITSSCAAHAAAGCRRRTGWPAGRRARRGAASPRGAAQHRQLGAGRGTARGWSRMRCLEVLARGGAGARPECRRAGACCRGELAERTGRMQGAPALRRAAAATAARDAQGAAAIAADEPGGRSVFRWRDGGVEKHQFCCGGAGARGVAGRRAA